MSRITARFRTGRRVLIGSIKEGVFPVGLRFFRAVSSWKRNIRGLLSRITISHGLIIRSIKEGVIGVV
jgi:hypothetical protein